MDELDEPISALALLGMFAFLIVCGCIAYVTYNQPGWEAQAIEIDRRAAIAAKNREAALKEQREEKARQFAKQEQERQAALRSDCLQEAKKIQAKERKIVNEHFQSAPMDCQYSRVRWTINRPHSSNELRRLHERYAKLVDSCKAITTLPAKLNGRSQIDAEHIRCYMRPKGWQATKDSAPALSRATSKPSRAEQNPKQQPAATAKAGHSMPRQRLEPPSIRETAIDVAPQPKSNPPAAKPISFADIVWAKQPSARAFSRAIPSRARDRDFPAIVNLWCLVRQDGKLDCTLQSELPAKRGFGRSALSLAKQYSAEPSTKDGRPSAGAQFVFPFEFKIES